MRKLIIIPVLSMLAACSGGSQPIDADKFFASLQGPNVPTVQDTMLESAKNAEKQGDYKAAAQIYQQMLEKKPNNKDLLLSLAECYRRSADFERAIALYDNVLLSEPGNNGAREGKGLALMAKGDFDTPVALFDKILKTEPTRWKTLNALGVLFTTRGMYSEAQQYFEAALKQNAGNPSIMNNLGLSQALNRQSDQAVTNLMQASALTAAESIDRKRIDLNLALVYAINGKLEDANAIAAHYFTGPVLDNNRGLYAHLAKDDQMAKAYLNMALTESKTFYEKAWNNLQQISNNSTVAGTGDANVPIISPEIKEAAPAATVPTHEKTVEKKKIQKAQPKKIVPKTDHDIADIVGDTGEKKDSVSDSPIP